MIAFQFRRKLSLLLSLAGAFCFHPALAANPEIRSGVDEGMMLHIAKDPRSQLVTGYFMSTRLQGQFSCIFYFKGKATGPSFEIETYFPETPNEVIRGKLTVVKPGLFKISLVEDHGGCWNVMVFANKNEPVEFSVGFAHPRWTAIKVLKAEKAHFFESPESKAPKKGYLVVGDPVGVTEARGEWLKVDYLTASKKLVSGWMKQADFFP